jgi:hypothetical protein
MRNGAMQSNQDFKRGEIVTDGDELLIIEQTPTLTDDSYVVSSYEDADDLVDDSDDDEIVETNTGTRSMGGAVGTMHRRTDE